MVVDANGPSRARHSLGTTIAAPANRHDSPLLEETLDTLEVVGELPERISVHLDRGYDSKSTRQKLYLRGLLAQISEKGKPGLRLRPPNGGWWRGRIRGATPTRSWSSAPSG